MPVVREFTNLRTHIAGVSVVELAEKYGTPTYVYDAGVIKERINDLRAFDYIRYAQKACSNLSILDLARREGVLVDAVSGGEVMRALAAGYSPRGNPPPIVYTADIFDRDALDLVVQHKLHVNCGSPDMIDQLGAELPGAEITLRINPGFGHGHSRKTNTGGDQSKHGIWHTQVGDCIARAKRHDIKIHGLHMHIGSGTDLEHLGQVCAALEGVAEQVGPSIHSISAGGGLPVPYRAEQTYVDLDAYFKLWDATRNRLAKQFGHKISLEIEPGRYLVAESGYLVAEIRAVKKMGDNVFYLLDAGFNNLARPILYGSYHPMAICPRSGDGASLGQSEVVVGGPLCESGDIFTQEEGGFVCKRRLPQADVGDFLVIENAGAYGFVMASNYNSKPLAAEVLVSGEKAQLVRARQTYEDILRGEKVVEW